MKLLDQETVHVLNEIFINIIQIDFPPVVYDNGPLSQLLPKMDK